MACVVRVLLCVFVLVSIAPWEISGKPFFGMLWCDLLCDDYDDDSTDASTTSFDDYIMPSACAFCPTARPARTTTTANPLGPLAPFKINIPPSPVGMNLSLLNDGGQWMFNVLPYMPATPAAAATPAAVTEAPADANTTTAASG